MNQKPNKILCQNPQHESKPIRVVCMKENCDQPSRMGCIDCIKYTHGDHNADLIEYKDVFNQNKDKMQTSTFPHDQTSKEYKLFTNDYILQKAQDMINEQIEIIKTQFIEGIEKFREYLLHKVKECSNTFKEEAESIFNKAYTLTPLREILIKNFDLKKDKESMNQDLEQFIQNKDRKDKVILLSEKLKQFNKGLDISYVQKVFEPWSQQIIKQNIFQIGDLISIMEAINESHLVKYYYYFLIKFLSSEHFLLLQTYLVRKVKTFKLLYRATRDGMNAQSFHSKCDKKGPTITVIQSKDHERIFGGFANVDWGSQDAWLADNERKGFLFSLTHKTKHEMVEGQKLNAIFCSSSYGPIFGGGGNDVIIANDYGMGSHSHLGYTYIPIVGAYGSSEAKSYLAGAYNFAVKEMEVFSVEFE